VVADFNPEISGRGKTLLLIFFKLIEKKEPQLFLFPTEKGVRKGGIQKSEGLSSLRRPFSDHACTLHSGRLMKW
jgi:hypothetical protein